ncbi:THO complex subunit 6 isoform X2 [Rhynchophorus ferrugineus]|uniref:THO complex subunit 6 n=1 Tax=Rhynchophorus ferrugineus TaxID=354439 RepID=A0A834IVI1_RHYFE|nr:hypothetical protein GWI33_000078 [Rhynchophorus ferrugineus]
MTKMNKEFYNTILTQTISPCGNYLITGDLYGNLSIFNLLKVLNPETNLTKEELIPKTKITVKADYQINSLVNTPGHLLVGVYGEIYAYTWKSIKGSNRNLHASWSIPIPDGQEELSKAEVNSLIFDKESGILYAACVLNGHGDYIHSIAKNGNNDLLSGGEDGVVNIWDLGSNRVVEKIEPYLNSEMQRTNLGKWIGAVDCNEDYILCGGGPRLSLFHYRFLTHSTVFPIDDGGIHVAHLNDDKVYVGGRCKLFYQASLNGNIISEIPTSGASTYSMVKQEEPFRVMCLAGSSSKIDISTNFIYKDQQLSLY